MAASRSQADPETLGARHEPPTAGRAKVTAAPLSNAPRPIDLSIETVDALVNAADAWRAIPALADAEQASRAQDFATQILNAIKRVDKEREEARQPHLQAAAAVQDAYRPLLERLKVCQAFVGGLLRDYKIAQERVLDAVRAEKERAAAEAARKAAEAAKRAEAPKSVADVTRAQRLADEADAARKAAAAVPERAQVRGELSGPRHVAAAHMEGDGGHGYGGSPDLGDGEPRRRPDGISAHQG